MKKNSGYPIACAVIPAEPRTARELKETWRSLRGKITRRLSEFAYVGRYATEEDLFAELVFCLFTPQSKARACWETVDILSEQGLLWRGKRKHIIPLMNRVRFKHNKTGYVLGARGLFSARGTTRLRERLAGFRNAVDARQWLVEHVKGLGYKEASHFLRNIGRGRMLAILDRHILRNLKRFGVIVDIPGALSERTYLNIEKKMLRFAESLGIPPDHLDLLFWACETGEIFK